MSSIGCCHPKFLLVKTSGENLAKSGEDVVSMFKDCWHAMQASEVCYEGIINRHFLANRGTLRSHDENNPMEILRSSLQIIGFFNNSSRTDLKQGQTVHTALKMVISKTKILNIAFNSDL